MMPSQDNFAAAPSPHGTPSAEQDCVRAGKCLKELFLRLGIVKLEEKGCWSGTPVLEHLGMIIDTGQMRVFVSEKKVQKVQRLAKRILVLAQRNARLVPLDFLRQFCGVCVSMTLASFYTRPLNFDVAR